jgi:IS5 family transposase
MRPKKHETTGSADLFRARLDQIINMRHELVQLARKIDWEFIDGEIAPLYSDGGRPGNCDTVCDWAFFAQGIFTDCPTKACANAGSMIHTSSTSPERSSSSPVKKAV